MRDLAHRAITPVPADRYLKLAHSARRQMATRRYSFFADTSIVNSALPVLGWVSSLGTRPTQYKTLACSTRSAGAVIVALSSAKAQSRFVPLR